MLPSVRDMTSLVVRRHKKPYVHLEEPSVDTLRQVFVSFAMSFSAQAYVRQICSFSRIHFAICLSQKFLRRSERTFC